MVRKNNIYLLFFYFHEIYATNIPAGFMAIKQNILNQHFRSVKGHISPTSKDNLISNNL